MNHHAEKRVGDVESFCCISLSLVSPSVDMMLLLSRSNNNKKIRGLLCDIQHDVFLRIGTTSLLLHSINIVVQ